MGNQEQIFETERLVLRPLHQNDVDLIVALNSDPDVMEFIGPADDSLEHAREYVSKRVEQYKDKPGLGVFIGKIKSSKETIGWFCLKYLDDTSEIEIGYRLLKEYWGKGFATEGAKCLLNNGFEKLKLKEIVGVTLPENKASQRVLEKIGLSYQGNGHYYGFDLSYFTINNEST